MKIIQESIPAAALRAFFTSACTIIGAFLSLIVFLALASLLNNENKSDQITYFIQHVQSDANGKRSNFNKDKDSLLELHIEGPIGTPALNAHMISQMLLEATEGSFSNKAIKGILLNINSPGGTVFDSDSIYRAIMRFKEQQQIPVYAYVDGICASGGVYIASSADKIYTSPSTLYGSIGVISQFMNYSKAMQSIGIESKTLTEGYNKDAMNPMRPWKENEDENFRIIAKGCYERFLEIVSKARPVLTRQEITDNLGARIFLAKDALKYGLIDHANAERSDAIRDLAKEANLDEYQVVKFVQKHHWMPNWLELSLSTVFNFNKNSTKGLQMALEELFSNGTQQHKILYLYQPHS